jgi:hypothetical protein
MGAGDQSSAEELIGASSRSVTTVGDEVGRLDQALLDLESCGAASVACTHCPTSSSEAKLARELTKAARARGFVSAHLSLEEFPVDAVDQLVAGLLDLLVPPDDSRAKGLLHLLDLYFEKHGARSVERFDEAAEAEGATGDLRALCRAYLAAEDDAHREVRALTLWAEGETPKAKYAQAGVRGTLNVHSGQRVFGELTRLVRALGHSGLVVVLSHGGSISTRSGRKREKSYTLLRELVDNFDSGRGAVCTRIVLTGDDSLFTGPKSLQSLAPLYARLSLPSDAEPPPPHRTWTSLIRDPYEYVHRRVRAPETARPKALRSLVRISQGLPPVDAVASMSVGHERIDKSIDRLFRHAEMAGSVFQVLSGEYGSGKTHLLLHLADRALAQGHPVFWLNLERMNLDLGNPARHLTRVLEQSVLPRRGKPSALDRLAAWTRSSGKLKRLLNELQEISSGESEESKAAAKALSVASEAGDAGAALEEFLSARDLSTKPGGSSYRLDAYRRLLLWMELLRRLEDVQGPVVLIDEAENLYTSGVSETARRSALRTLSFYCGGALPGACVVLAMTPPALAQMRRESRPLLREAADVNSTLDVEDVDLFRMRLSKLTPDEVPGFSQPMRRKLAERVRATHKSVRGPVEIEDWEGMVKRLSDSAEQPRALLRSLVDELEATWWGSR